MLLVTHFIFLYPNLPINNAYLIKIHTSAEKMIQPQAPSTPQKAIYIINHKLHSCHRYPPIHSMSTAPNAPPCQTHCRASFLQPKSRSYKTHKTITPSLNFHIFPNLKIDFVGYLIDGTMIGCIWS